MNRSCLFLLAVVGRWSLCFRVSRGACTALTTGWKALYTAGLQSSCSLPLLSPWLRWDVCSARPKNAIKDNNKQEKENKHRGKDKGTKVQKRHVCALPQSCSGQTCILQKFQWHVTVKALLNALAKGSFLHSYIFLQLHLFFVIFEEKLLLYSYISFGSKYAFVIFKEDLLLYSYFFFKIRYLYFHFQGLVFIFLYFLCNLIYFCHFQGGGSRGCFWGSAWYFGLRLTGDYNIYI